LLEQAWVVYIDNNGDGSRRGVRRALAAVVDHITAADPQAGEVFD
jgi:hypothetical protein